MNIDNRTSVAELLEENQRLRKKVRVARRNNRELRRALRARIRELESTPVHAACGHRHPAGAACVLESVRLVRERTAEREEALTRIRELEAELDERRGNDKDVRACALYAGIRPFGDARRDEWGPIEASANRASARLLRARWIHLPSTEGGDRG